MPAALRSRRARRMARLSLACPRPPTAHVTGSGGHFTVTGTHTYQEAGSFPVRVRITDTHPGGDGGGATATATSTATVSDAALSAAGIAVQAMPGTLLSGLPVANFT